MLQAPIDWVYCERTGKRSYRTVREAAWELARRLGRAGRQPLRSYTTCKEGA